MDKKQLMKLISFFTMGDGGLYVKNDTSNAKFIMNMRSENMDYVNWVSSTLSELTNVHVYNRPDYNVDGCNRKEQVRLESNTHPFLTKIRNRIYTIDKHKGIDLHALKLLDWESMAILYMSDGCLYEYLRPEIGMKNSSYNLTLNMKRLSEAEQLVLKQHIKQKLDIEFNVNRQNQYFYLRLRSKDVDKFLEGVGPYMCKSFKYKTIRTKDPKRLGGDIV
jgi:hypothetical protein